MGLKFANFAEANIATAPAGTIGLTFSVASGKGALFPTLSGGDFFYGVFVNAARTAYEIVKVEGRTGDAMTIAAAGRGQDGTSAMTWTADDYFYVGLPKVALEDLFGIGTGNPVLDELGSTATGKGAARVAIEDAGANYVSTTVEGALAEIWTKLASTVATIGSALVAYIAAGAGAVVRTVLAKLSDQVHIADYGGSPAASAAANTAAIAAAIAASRRIRFADGVYQFAASINLTRTTHLLGETANENNVIGTVFMFAVDQSGIIINRHNTLGYTTVANNTYQGAQHSIIENITVASAGYASNANADGIFMRATAVIRNVCATGFKRNGIRVAAQLASGGALEGNASQWRIDTAQVISNGSDGLYLLGSDANVGMVSNVMASLNSGWGVNDESGFGNNYFGCVAENNTNGPYRTTGASARHMLIGCWSEAGQPASSLVSPTMVIGGIHAAGFTPGTDAVVFSAGILPNGTLSYANARATPAIYSGMGDTDAAFGTLFWFGSDAVGDGPRAWRWVYEPTSKQYYWQHSVSGARIAMSFPGAGSTMRDWAPGFINGIIMGGINGRRWFEGAIAPTIGNWKQGDYVKNSAPAVGQPKGWYCTADGTPGTWVSEGNL